MRSLSPLPLSLSLILLGPLLLLTTVVRQRPEENHLQQFIMDSQLEKLTLVNLGETYQSVPASNPTEGRPRLQVTLKVVIRMQNISSDHVMTLATDRFRIVATSVYRDPGVGPIEVPDDFPSDEIVTGPCPHDLKPHQVVTVMPGKSYEAATQLKFFVVEDALADPPLSVNPGIYFLRARVLVVKTWDAHEHEGVECTSGPIDTAPMRFTVEGKSEWRKT